MPEPEDLVGPWRAGHDPSGTKGAPAHVTLLFRFGPLDQVGTALDEHRTIFHSVRRQPFRLAHIGVPGCRVARAGAGGGVHRAHRAPGRSLPDGPPHGGAYEQVIPHLTVIDHSRRDGSGAEVILLAEDPDGCWTTHTRFALG